MSVSGLLPVVHLSAEYYPYARTGGLAEAVSNLATFQQRAGMRVLALLPLYRIARSVATDVIPACEPFDVELGPARETAQLWRLPGPVGAPEIYAIGHDGFFDRDGIYGDGGADYADNPRRFAFFARAALDVLPRLVSGPVLLHAHDWHTALAPLYLRSVLADDPAYQQYRAVVSVHNPGYQGYFPASVVPAVGLPWSVYDWRCLEWYGQANFLKGGLTSADVVVTVSPHQAEELRTLDGGFGLHDVFRDLGNRLIGILNGIDQQVWDPEHDTHIAQAFSRENFAGKRVCKEALQRRARLPERRDVPLLAFIGRLARQKGLDILLDSAHAFELDAQYIFMGTGEARYSHMLNEAARRFPSRVAVEPGFSDLMEHRMIAGADILLMPSQYEPCGLTQMRAQRYGALPVARRVGGLVDTVEDEVTGFMFDEFTPEALEQCSRRALERFRDEKKWKTMMRAAMAKDFGWERTVDRYAEVYRRAMRPR